MLARRQDAELVAVRVCHDFPGDVALADVDTRRAEGDQALDLSLVIGTGRRGEVEVQAVLGGFPRVPEGRPS